ncbi:hypothetical protein B1R32_10839 [Abditibacterium utsteinense]|uniref:ACT domain-containing protein n=1 Tax=Abditibacterium utsteinense TaxID=1960156 RepID=A0A2S8SSR8_9BACT|nr:hypothetical protein [Abditibacterium utsteinense]PQV63835.1 hypothetical protein B1R32_10839 [Abditibacterium utsteinense]
MSTLDLKHGFSPGEDTPDDVVQAFFRAFLPDFYFVNAPISRMRRHLQLVRRLPATPLILDFHRSAGAQFTELTLCAHDDAEPGLLAKVAGTLAHLKINVHTAWIHTLRDPHAVESGRRIVLDTLILSESRFGRSRPLSSKTQSRIADTMTPILSAQSSIATLLFKTLKRCTPLEIEDLSALPSSDGLCLITLRAGDDLAVLYRVTRALAALEIDIAHAQINTHEKTIDDVFFVCRAGGVPLENTEIPSLLFALRETLQNDNFEAQSL